MDRLRSKLGNELLLDLIISAAVDLVHLALKDAEDGPVVCVGEFTSSVIDLLNDLITVVEDPVTPSW
jgi:hypothetical protein